MCRSLLVAAAALAVLSASACDRSGPPGTGPTHPAGTDPGSAAPASAPATLDPAIRRVDFGAITLQPEGTAGAVQFQGGSATRGSGKYRVSYEVSGGPVYADADGDGDEDATIRISDDGGGNAANSEWWVWLWDGGSVHQLNIPFGQHTRCGGPLALVSAEPDGFAVRDQLWAPGSSCADGSSTPESYTIGVRAGYVVRVRPALSAAGQCDPRVFDEAAAPPNGTALRVARDERAPVAAVVADGHRVQRRSTDRQLAGLIDESWVYLLHDDGRQRVCGWMPAAALAPPR